MHRNFEIFALANILYAPMAESVERSANSLALRIEDRRFEGDVDASQLPSGANPPSPSDPGFWDQIKAALSQVGAPITGAANAAMAPAQAVPA